MIVDVSVVIPVRNEERDIGECINSLLSQTFKNFEIVLVDDFSTDNTRRIIESLHDERIRYFRNEKNLGISESRNRGVDLSRGKYIFLTDGDCVVFKDWIEQGLKSFRNPKCVGVEGRLYYVSAEYKPTFSDHVCENKYGGKYMTGNAAYTRSAIKKAGGFHSDYNYHEDRELALRIKRLGRICFNPNMIVFAQQQNYDPRELLRSASNVKNRVYLFKRFGDKEFTPWRVVYPWNLAKAIFPPVVFLSLFVQKFKGPEDYRLIPFKYVYAILERLQLWKTCAKERVLLI